MPAPPLGHPLLLPSIRPRAKRSTLSQREPPTTLSNVHHAKDKSLPVSFPSRQSHWDNATRRNLLNLITESPRRLILGNWVSGNGHARKPKGHKKSRAY